MFKFILFICLFSITGRAQQPAFRLHLIYEPSNLIPYKQRTSVSSYLLNNLYRNLYKYTDKEGLVPDLVKTCTQIKKKIRCELKKDLKWSDGTLLTASDFIETYKKILTVKEEAQTPQYLFLIKNAEKIYQGKISLDKLGVKSTKSNILEFELEKENKRFLYYLSLLQTAPMLPLTTQEIASYKFSGPYKIKEWINGKKIILEPNLNYPNGNPNRPNVEFFFIPEDTVALKLYENNRLDFLRRLPTQYISKYKTSKEFYWIPVQRFDFFAFGPKLKNLPLLRKALSEALDYSELQKLYGSDERPGCPGIPDEWYNAKDLCISYNPKEAKKLLKDISEIPKLELAYSLQGGDDHKKTAEWMVLQWKKNLNINVEIKPYENKVFLNILNRQTPDIFRKGNNLDIPFCDSALSLFNENKFQYLVSNKFLTNLPLLQQENINKNLKELCYAGISYLINENWIIPMGKINFSILSKSTFRNWNLNSFNYLFLENLEYDKAK